MTVRTLVREMHVPLEVARVARQVHVAVPAPQPEQTTALSAEPVVKTAPPQINLNPNVAPQLSRWSEPGTMAE